MESKELEKKNPEKNTTAELKDDALEQITGGTFAAHEVQHQIQSVDPPDPSENPIVESKMFHTPDPLCDPNDKIRSVR